MPTDTRVVVNAPAYRMDVFENGQLVKSYKIGIGYPEFPLPQGLRKADTIIFNPVWTPPDEPWVKGKFEPGKKVEAGSKDNPLGPIKIPIGLPSLIHGGKSPAKLGTFASHGCVGLTNPQVQDFSLLLAKLGGTPLTKEEVDAHAKKKTETKDLKLANAVPVELRYETIVVEDGKLHINVMAEIDEETGEMDPDSAQAHACTVAEVEGDDETGEVDGLSLQCALASGDARPVRLRVDPGTGLRRARDGLRRPGGGRHAGNIF